MGVDSGGGGGRDLLVLLPFGVLVRDVLRALRCRLLGSVRLVRWWCLREEDFFALGDPLPKSRDEDSFEVTDVKEEGGAMESE